ncbi:hypothetical protein Tco_0693826 [Tanacetum coccineum]
MDTKLVEGSESFKKKKVDEDKETVELQRLKKVVLDKEEVAIDAIPLATKPPSIVDWKIHKEWKKSYYQIIRAGEVNRWTLCSVIFDSKSFDRERLETLYRLVNAMYGITLTSEDIRLSFHNERSKDDVLIHMLKSSMKNQLDIRVLDWKLYDSCGLYIH